MSLSPKNKVLVDREGGPAFVTLARQWPVAMNRLLDAARAEGVAQERADRRCFPVRT